MKPAPTRTYSINCGPCGCVVLLVLLVAVVLGLADMLKVVL